MVSRAIAPVIASALLVGVLLAVAGGTVGWQANSLHVPIPLHVSTGLRVRMRGGAHPNPGSAPVYAGPVAVAPVAFRAPDSGRRDVQLAISTAPGAATSTSTATTGEGGVGDALLASGTTAPGEGGPSSLDPALGPSSGPSTPLSNRGTFPPSTRQGARGSDPDFQATRAPGTLVSAALSLKEVEEP